MYPRHHTTHRVIARVFTGFQRDTTLLPLAYRKHKRNSMTTIAIRIALTVIRMWIERAVIVDTVSL